MHPGGGDLIAEVRFIRLKTDLDRIQSCLFQKLRSLSIEPDRAGNQVRVKTSHSGGGDELIEIRPLQRFAAGEPNMQRAQTGRFTQDTLPIGRFQLWPSSASR